MTDDPGEVALVVAHLIHSESDGLNRVRQSDGKILLLIVVNEDAQHLQLIPFSCARSGIKYQFLALHGRLVCLLIVYRFHFLI